MSIISWFIIFWHALGCQRVTWSQSIHVLCFHWFREHGRGGIWCQRRRVSPQRRPKKRLWGPLGDLSFTLWGVMSLAWWKYLAGLWNMVLFRELYNSCYSLMFRILKSGSSSTCFVLCLHVKKLNPKMGQFKWEFRLWSLHILTKLYNTWDLPMGRGSFSYVWTKMGGVCGDVP